MIAWDESMSTGVDYLDEQHKELFVKFNQLYEAVENGKGREETREILGFLQFYAEWHFEREEHCMAEHNCPVAEANQKAHTRFISRVNALADRYAESETDPQVMRDTVLELGTWLVNHIMGTDSKLRHCIH